MSSTSISRTHPSPLSLSFVSFSALLPVRIVSNTFVRASLEEVVYVSPLKILADRFGSKIMNLNKALYGLKQAPLSWNLHLENMFDTVKIIKAPIPCLYAYNNCTIVAYVDDLIISGPSVEEVIELKNIIKGLFVCTDAGAMKEYLSVLFERRDDDAFELSQRQYLLNFLQRFGMEHCKRCATSCVPRKQIDEASTDMSNTTFPYREAVGSLLYLSTHKDVKVFVQNCLHCVATIPGDKVPRPRGTQLNATQPNEILHLNFLYIVLSRDGKYQYLPLLKDDLSGYLLLVPCRTADSVATVDTLMRWLAVFGVVLLWISDRGRHFKNKVV
jgi:hypothetical protein